jgi:hypothetical protein
MRMREDEMRRYVDVAIGAMLLTRGGRCGGCGAWWVNFDAAHVTWIFPPSDQNLLNREQKG